MALPDQANRPNKSTGERKAELLKSTLIAFPGRSKNASMVLDISEVQEGLLELTLRPRASGQSEGTVCVETQQLLGALQGFQGMRRGRAKIPVIAQQAGGRGLSAPIKLKNDHFISLKLGGQKVLLSRSELYVSLQSFSRYRSGVIPYTESYPFTFANFSRFIRAADDWRPSFEQGYARAFLYCVLYDEKDGYVRMAVWGEGDYGMEMDWRGTAEEAIALFGEWKRGMYDVFPEPLEKQVLTDWGFHEVLQ